MSSAFSHAVFALGLGPAFSRRGKTPARFWLVGAACALIPDADVLWLYLGVPYDSAAGHRGLTHSLVFALALGFVAVAVLFRDAEWQGARGRLFGYFFLATASHGVLDAMTDGGRGVAFFWPFTAERYFLPLRPFEVSELGFRGIFPWTEPQILWTELLWVWLPSLCFAGLGLCFRRR